MRHTKVCEQSLKAHLLPAYVKPMKAHGCTMTYVLHAGFWHSHQ